MLPQPASAASPHRKSCMRECLIMVQRIDNRMRRGEQARAAGTRAGVFTAFGLAAEAEPLTPGLYVVATPIGNLKDVSFRALSVLAAADAVLAEDTRVTKTLLAHYGIATPLIAYHEHSNDAVRERMIHRIREGQALALVSDAGTPLVSDPGYRLVQSAIAEGLSVTPIPGPSAILTALVVSGLPTDRFFFEGFLPAKSGPRRARLEALATIPGTLMLFEAPHRLPDMLSDAAAVLGSRPAVVARELTKLFETVRRGTLDELAAALAAEGPPKGEIVVLIGAAPEGPPSAAEDEALDARLTAAMAHHSIKDAAALVASECARPKREVYARALALAKAKEG
jgi:16S rRNA (cytidine1402-2'-O)-methyltransferase